MAEEFPVLPSLVGEGSSNEEPESLMMGSIKDEKNTMEGFQWDSLLEAPIQVQLGQLLRLVPNFHKALLTAGEGVTAAGVQSAAPVSITQRDPVPESPIMDTRVPEISVEYRGIQIDNVLIDGGAGVNIVTKTTCERFGWLDWLPVPFLV